MSILPRTDRGRIHSFHVGVVLRVGAGGMPWRLRTSLNLSESLFLEAYLLDSRVCDVPRAYALTCVILSSWKPLFFNSLKNES